MVNDIQCLNELLLRRKNKANHFTAVSDNSALTIDKPVVHHIWGKQKLVLLLEIQNKPMDCNVNYHYHKISSVLIYFKTADILFN